MIKTESLTIRTASDDEMRTLIENESDDELRKAYGEMLEGCINEPEKRCWYAAWFIELPDGTRVGDLCFKGLAADGAAEIGYGLLPEHRGLGYATEAVAAAVEWAMAQPGVTRIEAETEEQNAASQNVLRTIGFLPTGTFGEEGPRFVYKKAEG